MSPGWMHEESFSTAFLNDRRFMVTLMGPILFCLGSNGLAFTMRAYFGVPSLSFVSYLQRSASLPRLCRPLSPVLSFSLNTSLVFCLVSVRASVALDLGKYSKWLLLVTSLKAVNIRSGCGDWLQRLRSLRLRVVLGTLTS